MLQADTTPAHRDCDRKLPPAAEAPGGAKLVSSGVRTGMGPCSCLRGRGPMRRPRPLGGFVAIAIVVMTAAAGLSACAGLPSSTDVQQGSLVWEPALQPVRVQPDGPAPGATPEQIVRGFLRAGGGAGFDDDHAVARSFLARSIKDQWQPDSGVTVYTDDSGLKVEPLTPSTIRVTASVVAEVDSSGRYRETPAGTSAHAAFGMQKLGGSWRISSPPKGFGLWLGEDA